MRVIITLLLGALLITGCTSTQDSKKTSSENNDIKTVANKVVTKAENNISLGNYSSLGEITDFQVSPLNTIVLLEVKNKKGSYDLFAISLDGKFKGAAPIILNMPAPYHAKFSQDGKFIYSVSKNEILKSEFPQEITNIQSTQ